MLETAATNQSSSARSPVAYAARRCTRSSYSARCNTACSASKGLPVARASFDTFFGEAAAVGLASEMHRRSVATVNSGWAFVEMAAGEEERKKNMILGFHGFYHGGPYGFIIFPSGRKFLIFCV